MKSPLTLRRLQALREIAGSPEVLKLKEEIAERHRQIRALTQDAEDLANVLYRRLRTEFLQLPGENLWMSMELDGLEPDGTIRNPRLGCRLWQNSSGAVYRVVWFWHPVFVANTVAEAVRTTKEQHEAQGWRFLPCEWEAVNKIRITDWGDLA